VAEIPGGVFCYREFRCRYALKPREGRAIIARGEVSLRRTEPLEANAMVCTHRIVLFTQAVQ
jgi:hypothetical protein